MLLRYAMSQSNTNNSNYLPIWCIGYTIQSLKEKYNISKYHKSFLMMDDIYTSLVPFIDPCKHVKNAENTKKHIYKYIYMNANANKEGPNFYIIDLQDNSTDHILISKDDYPDLLSIFDNICQFEPISGILHHKDTKSMICDETINISILLNGINSDIVFCVQNTLTMDDIFFHCYRKNEVHTSIRQHIPCVDSEGICFDEMKIKFTSKSINRYTNKQINYAYYFNGKLYNTPEPLDDNMDEHIRYIKFFRKRSAFIGFVKVELSAKGTKFIYEDYLITFHYTWKVIRLIWIGFIKNQGNTICYFSILPKDIIRIIVGILNNIISFIL
jgi:hypothetical protein